MLALHQCRRPSVAPFRRHCVQGAGSLDHAVSGAAHARDTAERIDQSERSRPLGAGAAVPDRLALAAVLGDPHFVRQLFALERFVNNVLATEVGRQHGRHRRVRSGQLAFDFEHDPPGRSPRCAIDLGAEHVPAAEDQPDR